MRSRVTCQFRGRLGNQMFLAATAMAFAWEHQAVPVFTKRQRLNIVNPDHQGPNQVTRIFPNLPTRLFLGIGRNPLCPGDPPDFSFQPIPFQPGRNYVIDGFRQSEKYFVAHRPRILEAFTLRASERMHLNRKYADWLKGNTASLHVRRTDYTPESNTMFHHLYRDLAYYQAALARLPRLSSVLVFSDDIPFCRQNLNLGVPTRFVEGEQDHHDMYLMSQCRHNIVANSTFSWWGAWLNTNPEKVVVAPKSWGGPAWVERGYTDQDIVPERWIRI